MEIRLKLQTRWVEKPWGRTALPALFDSPDGRRIGEIWFEAPGRPKLPLLAKFLFTSERLSVQVHPRSAGPTVSPPTGKTECWYIVDAEPGAAIGLGLRRRLSRDEARQAALDGSIDGLLAWRPVKRGDFVFVPSGTIHAVGAGLAIIELQQNCDVTYRMFDYGRPRPLHLDEALDVARLEPSEPTCHVAAEGSGDRILVSAPEFTIVQATSEEGAQRLAARERWVLPIAGSVTSANDSATCGECLLVAAGVPLHLSNDAVVIVAAEGPLES